MSASSSSADLDWLQIVLFSSVRGVVCALVVTVATFAAHKLGGTVGGLIATLPFLSLFVVVGLAYNLDDDELIDSLYSAGVSSIPTAALFCGWRASSWVILQQATWPQAVKVPIPPVSALGGWAVAAATALLGISAISRDMLPVLSVGCIGMTFAIGSILMWDPRVQIRAPSSAQSMLRKVVSYSLRAAVTFLVVLVIGVIAPLSPALGGLLSAFPAVGLLTLCSVWNQEGLELSRDMSNKMILGNTTVFMFSILCALQVGYYNIWAIIPASFVGAILLFSVPLYFLLSARDRWIDALAPEQAPILTTAVPSAAPVTVESGLVVHRVVVQQ